MPTQSSSPHLPFGENKNADWYGKDILSVKQFSRDDLEYVFGVAHEMRGMVERVGTFDLLKGKILANLFYEPSTRTSSSIRKDVVRQSLAIAPEQPRTRTFIPLPHLVSKLVAPSHAGSNGNCLMEATRSA